MAQVIANTNQQIGDFRERIQILQMQQNSDGFGGYVETWIIQKSIWGYIRMIDVPEISNKLRQEHIANYEIITRYNTIKPEQRVIFRGSTAIIKNIMELDNRKKFISFIAQIIIN